MSDHPDATDEPNLEPTLTDIAFRMGHAFGVMETKLDRLIEIAGGDRAADTEDRP